MIKKIFYILSMIFIMWFFLSYFEILCKNDCERPIYSEYNIFTIAMEIYEKSSH